MPSWRHTVEGARDGTMRLANEYLASRCTHAELALDPTCGDNRTFFANWSTHINAGSDSSH